MTSTKIVCRLFGLYGEMLGWTALDAAVRGDAMLRASAPVVVIIDAPGIVSSVSWHWADVNVETRVPLPPAKVIEKQVVLVAQQDDPLIVCGSMPGPLPAVTVAEPIHVGVPVGALGAPAGTLVVAPGAAR